MAADFLYHRKFAVALDAWCPHGAPHGRAAERAPDAHLTDATLLWEILSRRAYCIMKHADF